MALKGLEKGAGSKISIGLYFKNELLLASHLVLSLPPQWLHGNHVCSKQFWYFVYSQIKPVDKKALDLFLVHRDSFYKHQRREP